MGNDCLKLVSVQELLEKQFSIPSYQRGYRWTEQQVKDLLNDIEEFIKSAPKANDFYCLQPLVVKGELSPQEDDAKKWVNEKNWKELKKQLDNSERWEVIDGQQRLTTIHLLLTYLGVEENNKYSIVYETRKGSPYFLNNIAQETKKNAEQNIDFFHMWQAYDTIKKWFTWFCGKDKNFKDIFKEKLLNQVQFIWFESEDKDPIAVFTRLNIGKIPLTNAELIKAMMLNRSNWENGETKSIALRQSELALQWDEIEYTLQNDEFWMFFHDKGFDKPTRIELLLDWIQEKDKLGIFRGNDGEQAIATKNNAIGNDMHKTFRYFYHFFYKAVVEENKSKIELAWGKVREKFGILKDWYNDLEMYHYIGYISLFENQSMLNMLDAYKGSKSVFIHKLKRKIKEILQKIPHPNASPWLDQILKNTYDTPKGPPKQECRKILWLFNILTVVNQHLAFCNDNAYQKGIFYKFPFHLLKSVKQWDIEHIAPNTDNEITDKKTQKEWILNAWYDLQSSSDLPDDLKSFVSESLTNDENRNNEFKRLYSKLSQQAKPAQPLEGDEKNQIWNFAMLDSSTNESYGNALFPTKRRIILGKDQGEKYSIVFEENKLELHEESAKIDFIPPCTRNAFVKSYSKTKTDPWVWSRQDAQCYLDTMKKTLENFFQGVE
ncbi:MAG: DUF262 domain-containing protein [Victivallaceae bacterium]|nr:DUF262 domain-containing protein [Victivallaceae bacterium]